MEVKYISYIYTQKHENLAQKYQLVWYDFW